MARPAAPRTRIKAVARKKRAMSKCTPPRTTAIPTATATATPATAPTVPSSGSLVLAPMRASTNTPTSKPSRRTAKKAMAARAPPEPVVRRLAAPAVASLMRSFGKRRIHTTM